MKVFLSKVTHNTSTYLIIWIPVAQASIDLFVVDVCMHLSSQVILLYLCNYFFLGAGPPGRISDLAIAWLSSIIKQINKYLMQLPPDYSSNIPKETRLKHELDNLCHTLYNIDSSLNSSCIHDFQEKEGGLENSTPPVLDLVLYWLNFWEFTMPRYSCQREALCLLLLWLNTRRENPRFSLLKDQMELNPEWHRQEMYSAQRK